MKTANYPAHKINYLEYIHRKIRRAGTLSLFLFSAIAFPVIAATPNQITNLKVLLLANDSSEPTTEAWETILKQEGVPYDKVVTTASHTGLDTQNYLYQSSAQNACVRANYQAVIITSGGLYPTSAAGALTPSEQASLVAFEAACGIRQISAYVYPSSTYGMNTPTSEGDLGGTTVNLTVNGLSVFPYLKGPVKIEGGSWAYYATPTSTTNFKTLISGPNNSSLLGIYSYPDKREEMVGTVNYNGSQLQTQLLRHGMLNWVTRGVYLGHNRNYFTMHVDDIFIEDSVWDTNSKSTSNTETVRMTAADVQRAVNWQKTSKIKLDFLFNGAGSVEAGGAADPLTAALLANKSQFYWLNHTYNHFNFDNLNEDNPLATVQLASVADIANNISQNITFAKNNKLPGFDANELVTGTHSGLYNNYLAPGGYQAPWPGNPNLGAALVKTGILWTGSDGSISPDPYTVPCTSATVNPAPYSNTYTYTPASGPVYIPSINMTIPAGTRIGNANLNPPYIYTNQQPASVQCTKAVSTKNPVWTVPRHPTNMYYNAATQAQQLDEYNYFYLPPSLGGGCVATAATTCISQPVTWDEYLNKTGDQILGHVLGNDPRPHYVHQTNLAADGILYSGMNNFLGSYNKYVNLPLVRLSLTDTGNLLLDRAKWKTAWTSGAVSGYTQNGIIYLKNNGTVAVPVPVTGAFLTNLYGGQYSTWKSIPAKQSALFLATPQ